MDRTLVFADELLLNPDLLKLNRNVMVGLAKLSAGILGTNTHINGLDCTPTSPASMQVTVGAGEIYQLMDVDDSTYGTLPADTTHQILKQGIVLDSQNFSCPAPITIGFSINYLIQVKLTEQDTDSASRAFYNTGQPNGVPPNFTTVNQRRQDLCDVQIKTGIASATGTQVTPSPDTGYVGAWVITVAYGQTTITSSSISKYPSAPFIPATIDELITQAQADARYGQKVQIQDATFIYGIDTSITANTITANLIPVPGNYVEGMAFYIKIANTNTGSSVINLNGLGNKTIKNDDGSNLSPGNLRAGQIAMLSFDGTNVQLKNPLPSKISASHVTVRQTVLTGSVDSNGVANFLSAGSGLSVNLAATTVPLNVAFASGFNSNGNADYVANISADVSGAWSSLTPSTTLYLYADLNTGTGAITYGFTALAPTYGYGIAISTANGQHTYRIDSGLMYVGNGATSTIVTRVFLGECVTGVGSVTSIITYALQGRYESLLTNITLSQTYIFLHNIGLPDPNLHVMFRQSSSFDWEYAGSFISTDIGVSRGFEFGVSGNNSAKLATASTDLAPSFNTPFHTGTIPSGQVILKAERDW